MTSPPPRRAPLDLSPDEFRALGHDLVDRIADFLGSWPNRPVTRGAAPSAIRALVPARPLPEDGAAPEALLRDAAALLTEHSLHNGHPRFFGYITSSAAPIGMLGDLLAAAVNPNVGGYALSPVATEIERQTVAWIAEMIGLPKTTGGILVSGGNMANFVGFLVARRIKAGWDVRGGGVAAPGAHRLRVYTSAETHTWIEKATDLFGLGTEAIRWIPTDRNLRMDVAALRRAIDDDIHAGHKPMLVVGTAGSVSTGAVDPLDRIHDVCREYGLWFHVDGAYGAFAAAVPSERARFAGLAEADSVALDAHKWLYAPLEASCALVRDPEALHDTFCFHPPYYRMDEIGGEPATNFHEYGPQNSRGFRALKIWLALQQVGRAGYVRMIGDDIALTRRLYDAVKAEPDLEAFTCDLSIATFRYAPRAFAAGASDREARLNELNETLLARLQDGGEAFVSNAVMNGTFALRTCIVNFRTSEADVLALPKIVARVGRETAAERKEKPS
ncbi:MAG: pyridoxal phosphate-dependent decarboxylase family protein [Hyphomicrobiales bacterium]